ncbi:MAG: serine/threonine protein kinase [Chloroflexi bacterium]|nr:serine/threonine protein kinase [Chloroflexota bacterium]
MSQPTWIGRTISGRYHIDELLGQGGMSAVYKATDPNLQRVVAIKIIHNHLSGDPDFIKRFEREAAAVAHLRHSNIIQVYDFNHDGDAYYIVFEYVAGVTLQDRLKKLNELHQQMPAGEAIDIAVGLGEAVHYAHKQGLVHRDIKPANVMLNSRNEPILMDFGIAKIVGGAKHTATGATLGTAQYMSPEQIKGEAIDARTDIYALGITLFEMLGGRSPFDADSTMAVMMMHVQNPVPDLRDIRRDVPVDVVMILKKAMAKEPDGRYQNAAQFVEALRNARLNLPSEEVTWAGGGVTAVEDRTMVEPMTPINATQKIDPPKGVTIVDAQPIQEQYVPVLLPSQQYPVRRRSKSKLLAPVLVVLVLALIAAGVWFAFFREPSVEDLLADADALAAAGAYDEAILRL